MAKATQVETLKQKIAASSGDPVWLTEIRNWALEKYSEMEWPSKRMEEWRRTRITKVDLDSLEYKTSQEQQKAVLGGSVLGGGWNNGTWCDPIVSDSAKALGIELMPMSEAISKYPEKVQTLLEESKALVDNRFTAWHFAQFETATFLRIPKNKQLEGYIELDLVDDRTGGLSSHHLMVWAEDLSESKILVRVKNTQGGVFFNNLITAKLSDAARLEILQIQDIHKDSWFVQDGQGLIGRDAQLRTWDGTFGSDTAKTRFWGRLQGEGSEFLSKGMFFSTGRQHKDIRVVQIHESAHAHSDALHKGAVRDKGKTVFQGMIEVKENAPQTDAYLTNKNLILNDGARADSLPMLKIDNNDVKCSHGSTTGKVDEEEVFYLKSRGLSEKDAKLLISQGLFQDIIESAPEFLHEELETLVASAIGG